MSLEEERPAIRDLGNGCYNLRGSFAINGWIEIGTHMSLIKLSSGKFVALSTIALTDKAEKEVRALTSDGVDLEAVIATNPWHTMAFERFHALFPNAKYYGTPRHLRNIPSIPWTGSIADVTILNKWAPELQLRIPAGCEFDNPTPDTNHFNGVVAFHPASRTVISDDCFEVSKKVGIAETLFERLYNHRAPRKDFEMGFHGTLLPLALDKRAGSAQEFYKWMQALLQDWDFDNIATAHTGVHLEGRRESMRAAVERIKPELVAFSVKHGGSEF